MQRSLGHMVSRKLGGGFASWREYVSGKPTDDPMAKALRHMMNRELSRGWVACAVGRARSQARVDAQEPWTCDEPRAVEGVARLADGCRACGVYRKRGRAGMLVNASLPLGLALGSAQAEASAMAKGLGHMLHRGNLRASAAGWATSRAQGVS